MSKQLQHGLELARVLIRLVELTPCNGALGIGTLRKKISKNFFRARIFFAQVTFCVLDATGNGIARTVEVSLRNPWVLDL